MAISTAFRIGLILSFTMVSVISFGVYWKMASLFESSIFEDGALIKNSLAAKLYETIPFDIQQNIYIFNITNRDEFLAGDKPRFDQLGPYTFNLRLRKEMSWTENGSLTFIERRLFTFVPELSKGNLTDTVCTVDPVYAVVQEVFDELPQYAQALLRPLLERRNIIFEHTVDELLYTGYADPLADFAHIFKPDLPVIDGRIGYLRSLNDSSDGPIRVYSGDTTDSVRKRNEIFQWKGKNSISYYGERCNKLFGTNGELFPAFDFGHVPPRIDVFQALLCRPWSLHFNGTVRPFGLDLAKFNSREDIFSPTGDVEFDECQQPHGWPRGIFDISNCQHGFPALVSLPHFLRAEQCLDDVIGLQPNITLHDFEFDVFPLLGIPVRPALRVQINVRVQRQFSSKSPSIIYPVLWQEIVLSNEDSQYLSWLIYFTVSVTEMTLSGILLLLSFVALVLAVFNCRYFGRNRKVKKDDEQPILAPADELEVSPSEAGDQNAVLT